MGNCCLPIRFRRTSSAVNPKSVTLLLLGLDNAGKTTIAKRLAEEPVDSVVPTVGFSVILLRQKGCHVSIYDLGGGPQIRDIWPRYYADAHGIIFVTDAKDIQRMEECRQVLQGLLRNEQISGKPLLLLANKQDLEGALDEIDVVDRLNLERLVNEQKCPTLVELSSALDFTKKIDIGIDNGYKWLVRSIIKDYPSLNNRVLKDLAKQDEENRVQVMMRGKRREREEIHSYVKLDPHVDPFKPVKKLLEEKSRANGIAKPLKKNSAGRSVPRIPGLVEDVPEKEKKRKNQIQRFLGEEIVNEMPASSSPSSFSSEFFIVEKFKSDWELLNAVPNQTLKNFLVRPKSSGARLYGVRSEKKKIQRRKPLRKGNKTGPAPDISNVENTAVPERLRPAGSPPPCTPRPPHRRRPPHSGRAPGDAERNSAGRGRRHSTVNGQIVGGAFELTPLKASNKQRPVKEIVLDITTLWNLGFRGAPNPNPDAYAATAPSTSKRERKPSDRKQ